MSTGIIASQKGYISGLDPDAVKFVNACRGAGVRLTVAEQQYIQFLVASLKGNDTSYNPSALNIWDDIPAIWPYVGRSKATHALNLKDPRDADDAFRLDFLFYDFIHDANGVTPPSTTGFARTFLIPSSHPSFFNSNSFCGFFYNRQDVVPDNQPTQIEVGSSLAGDAGIPENGFCMKRIENFGFAALNRFPEWLLFFNYGTTGYKGTWLWQKNAANYREIVKDNTILNASDAETTFNVTDGQMILFNRMDEDSISTKPMSLHGFSRGLSIAKRTALINIINQAQAVLGRAA